MKLSFTHNKFPQILHTILWKYSIFIKYIKFKKIEFLNEAIRIFVIERPGVGKFL